MDHAGDNETLATSVVVDDLPAVSQARFRSLDRMQLRGRAQILDWTDAEAREVFSGFLLGRQIINSYRELHGRGASRICFLRIDLDPLIRTYLVGTSSWRVRRSMESGTATATRQ